MIAPPPLPASACLRVADLACERGGREVFSGVDFTLSPGEALQLEGRNGAGKSSLLRLLAGLLEPAAGRIDNPFEVAWAGHEVALKAGVTLAAELGYWARLDGAAPDAVVAALARFDLGALADVPCGTLSSGQRRRAALARASLSGAALWLLDEPSVGLDTAARARLGEVLAVHRAGGGLVIAATHESIGLTDPRFLRLGA